MQHLQNLLTSGLPLTHLNLSFNNLGPEGVQYLVNSRLPLSHLDLASNGLGPEEAQCIANSNLPLIHLDLSFNALEPQGAQCIAESNLPLTHLNLSFNNLGPEGVQYLVNSRLPLSHLVLIDIELEPEGAQHLANSTGLTALRVLDLEYNNLSAAAVTPLADAIRTGIAANGEQREVLPSIERIVTGNEAADELLANAIAARRARLAAPRAGVNARDTVPGAGRETETGTPR